MPISGPSSYPAVVVEFLEHWRQVNLALGAGNELTIVGGAERVTLNDLGEDLNNRRDAVTDLGIDRSLARENLVTLLTALQERVVEFNGRVRADLPDSAFSRILPEAFSVGQGEAPVRENLRQISRIWTKLNALTPVPTGLVLPLVLREGFDLAALNTAREALRLAYIALSDADVDLSLARQQRNDVQDLIYPILKNYRLKVPSTLPPGSALVESLPALTPKDGHTPDAVVVQAEWNVAAAQAKITWAASTDAALARTEIRAVPGAEYVTDDEVVVGTVLPGQPPELLTLFALSAVGLTASFKVYVVLDTGNERGSEAVSVTRTT